ncbi:MAG: hypothetical protein OXH52_17480 [Gammaproteobacteria bacterium]|nr:hypothetical protein [Gammaproteobacteria bacterium]
MECDHDQAQRENARPTEDRRGIARQQEAAADARGERLHVVHGHGGIDRVHRVDEMHHPRRTGR